jgi:hypothetical protein
MGDEKNIRISSKETSWETRDIDKRIILSLTLKKYNVRAWTDLT